MMWPAGRQARTYVNNGVAPTLANLQKLAHAALHGIREPLAGDADPHELVCRVAEDVGQSWQLPYD